MSHNPAKLNQILAELKVEYLASFPQKIQKLKALTQSKDWTQLAEEYHKLKGTGKTYGFPEVSTICEKLETLATHNQTHLQHLFEQAIELLERMHKAYQMGNSFELDSDPTAKSIMALKLR